MIAESQMKDSGIDRIGKIPEGWEKIRSRFVFGVNKGSNPNFLTDENNEGNLSPYLDMDFIRTGKITKFTENVGTKTNGESILILWDGSKAGDVFYLEESGVIGCTLSLINVENHSSRKFIYYILKSSEKIIKINNTGMGVPHVNGNFIKDLELCLPPIEEQKRISDYLDKKTQQIDELVQKTEKKIELLKEQRTALINHCVTKGLNPDAEMKDSGIEWIGEIPESWKVLKTKYFTTAQKRPSIDGSEPLLSVTENLGVVPRENVKNFSGNLSRSESLIGYLKVEKGNLVSNIMLMWKRGLGVSTYNGIVSPAYSVFSFNIHSYPRYFNYLFRSDMYISEFRRNSTGIIMSRLRLYDDSFGSIFSHFPPLEEQKRISDYLDQKTQQIDKLVEKEEKRISLLKEYRQSLISSAVTGKIRITEAML